MKFKKGDNVKLIENEAQSINSIGDIGTIVEHKVLKRDISYRVQVEGKADTCNWSLEDDLKLISTTGDVSNIQVYPHEVSPEEAKRITGVSVKRIVNFTFLGIGVTLEIPLWKFTKLYTYLYKHSKY